LYFPEGRDNVFCIVAHRWNVHANRKKWSWWPEAFVYAYLFPLGFDFPKEFERAELTLWVG